MQPISIQKGSNETFYFAESEPAQASAAIYQLNRVYNNVERKYEMKKTKIHDVNNGKVLALELDADNMSKQ